MHNTSTNCSGTHRWPTLRRHLVAKHLNADAGKLHPLWATLAEPLVNAAAEKEFRKKGVKKVTWLGSKGDLLIWSGRLMHRGSVAVDSSLLRPGIIAHYSDVNVRPEFGDDIRKWKDGGYYWHNGQSVDQTEKWYIHQDSDEGGKSTEPEPEASPMP